MLSIETTKGVLKYRMPNVLEIYELLEVTRNATDAEGKVNLLKAKRELVRSLGPYVDFTGIEGVNTYEELLNIPDEMMQPLSTIADELFIKVGNAFRKKN